MIDLKPYSMLNDPGFLNYSKLLDPRFVVGSVMFYRGPFDNAYILGIRKRCRRDEKKQTLYIQLAIFGFLLIT